MVLKSDVVNATKIEKWSKNPKKTRLKMSNTRKKLMRSGKIIPPLKLPKEKYKNIKSLYIKGKDVKEISCIIGCSYSAVYRCVKELREKDKADKLKGFKDNLKKLSEADRGYVAGILDGEGSIIISLSTTVKKPNKKYYSASVVIGNQDNEIINFMYSKLGLKTKIYNYRGRKKDMIIKLYGKERIIVFLEFIQPYIHSEKTRRKIGIILKFCIAKTQKEREGFYKKLKTRTNKK